MTNDGVVSNAVAKQPKRGNALFGWSLGAVLTLGAYLGALALYPAAPTSSVVASIPGGIDRVLRESESFAATEAQQPLLSSRSVTEAPSLSGELTNRLDEQGAAISRLATEIDALYAPLVQIRQRLATVEDEQGMLLAQLDTMTTDSEIVTASIDRPNLSAAGQAETEITANQETIPEAMGDAMMAGSTVSSTADVPSQAMPDTMSDDGTPMAMAEDAEGMEDNQESMALEPRVVLAAPAVSSGQPASAIERIQVTGNTRAIAGPNGEVIEEIVASDEPQRDRVVVEFEPLRPESVQIASAPLETEERRLADTTIEDMIVEDMLDDAVLGADPIITGSLPRVREGEALVRPDAVDQIVTRTPFAVDLGGVATLEEIDRMWMEKNQQFGDAFDGMIPRIMLKQTPDGQIQLHLLVGPIDDAADAALTCVQLVAAGLRECLPTIYDGQLLSLQP